MRPRPRTLLVTSLASGLLVAACSTNDGRTLAPVDPDKTTTSLSQPIVGQPSEDGQAVEVFSLSSSSFADGAEIPTRHTCFGEDLSPALEWASTPPAGELALVVRDRSANGFVHWVISGIDRDVQGFAEGGVPEGAVEGANSTGTVGWFGPCPPSGSGKHTYDFVLHVLPEPLTLEPGQSAEEAAKMIEGASSGQAMLSGTVTARG